MKADEWADSTYNHERAKSVARKLVESCGLTPEGVRARALALSPPPVPSPWGHNRGVPMDSEKRYGQPFSEEAIALWREKVEQPIVDAQNALLSTDIGQQGAGPPGAAPGRDDLLSDSPPEAA